MLSEEELSKLTTEQLDIRALTYIVRDLTDAVAGLYSFCQQMFDIHWPPSEAFNEGRKDLDYAQERLAEARIFDHYTREWLNKEIKDGTGDRE